jgi:2-polyprenyl-6-methoxyphenol hydroxylase-like FAD-dependent oxidoreductase
LNAMMDFRWRRSVMDRHQVRHWHKGRVVLLGDAAHAAAAITGAGRLHGD